MNLPNQRVQSRLKWHLAECGLSDGEFCKWQQIAPSTFSKIVRGIMQPNDDFIRKIDALFGKPVTYYLLQEVTLAEYTRDIKRGKAAIKAAKNG